MNPKILFGFALALFVVVAEVSGRSCAGCGFGRGSDYCAACNPTFLHAVSVKSPRAKCLGKNVGGDVCNKIEVKPMNVPKPKTIFKQKHKPVCDARPLVPAPDHLHDFSQDVDVVDTSYLEQTSSCGRGPLYPVDAVSMSLVSRLQDSWAVSPAEERLQYGFYTAPQEAPVIPAVPRIAEEKLQAVDRPVVELRGPQLASTCGSGCGQEEIVLDANPQPVPYLSYTDVGYLPEEVNQPKFITTCKRKGHACSCSCEDSSEEDYKYVVRSKKSKPCSS